MVFLRLNRRSFRVLRDHQILSFSPQRGGRTHGVSKMSVRKERVEASLHRRNGILRLVLTMFALSVLSPRAVSVAQEHQRPDSWPATTEEAVSDFVSRISLRETWTIKQTSEKDVVALYGIFGVQIRNRYGLWRGNDKLILSVCGFPCHPDDASMKIIESVWLKLRN